MRRARSSPACLSTTRTPVCTRSSNRWTRHFVGKAFGSDAGYLYKYDYNVTDAGYYFTYRTANPTDYVPLPFKPETHESDPHPEVFERFVLDDQQRVRRGVPQRRSPNSWI